MNMFLYAVRFTPEASALVIVADVRANIGAAVALSKLGTSQRANLIDLAREMRAHPDEALSLAAWAIYWKQLPPQEKAKQKQKSASDGIHARMSTKPPSEKQLTLLRKLGHADPPASMAEASGLIDHLLRQQREIS